MPKTAESRPVTSIRPDSAFMPAFNRKFRRRYDKIFRRSPLAANIYLLLFELGDARGEIQFTPCPEVELADLLPARFEDPWAYQFNAGAER